MIDSQARWASSVASKADRLARAADVAEGRLIKHEDARALLERVLRSGDRVCLEGNNQKQADFLAEALASVDPAIIHDLHMLQSVVALPAHVEVFEKGIAREIDFSFSGPQSARLASLVAEGRIRVNAIHTYIELFGRYLLDLTPQVALVAAEAADDAGNLYTGPNTEETPTIVEATAFKGGVVIAQVNELRNVLPRVDVPGDWVDFVVVAPKPNYIEPLFTRDPARITDAQVLLAMMVIKGIYAEYGVRRLNHGIGFDTAAIELLLPTYAVELGLKGQICTHWALNPHPTLIPAIEAGLVQQVHCFGGELGMERYVRARPDIFFTGHDGSLRSNRTFSQMAGLYACDLFIGATLQIDLQGNSSTATAGRIAGFGGAPNMGSDARGRRHESSAWLRAGEEARHDRSTIPRGRKLVVQMVRLSSKPGESAFVERLDAWTLAEKMGVAIPPVMIYGDDLTHVVTEEGIANLLLCRDLREREQAIRGVAGDTSIGLARDKAAVEELRRRGAIRRPEDLGVDRGKASADLLAAHSIADLVKASGGLYDPPPRFLA